MKIFWSWQSDTPGKTGRHFIRKALQDAINELKEPEEVEEPIERDIKDSLHLDQDRQGVSGSPDLARTILDKIDVSTVFVADVTPVSIIPSKTTENEETQEKRNMNPNVAIEMGYALRTLTDKNVLMVLNTHYGGRQFLPFDLAHKGGPILFRLPPDADGKKIKTESVSLKAKLVTALRPYIINHSKKTSSTPSFLETPSTLSAAVYFQANETLAAFGEEYDKVEYAYPDGNGFFLRLIPYNPLPKPIYKSTLIEEIRRGTIFPMWHQSGLSSTNHYGAITIEPGSSTGGSIKASTQVFINGEIWGIARWLLKSNEHGLYIPGKPFEDTFRRSLSNYVDFMQYKLNILPPYTVEAGVVGIQDYRIIVDATGMERYGPFFDNEMKIRLVLNENSAQALDTVLLKFFEELFMVSGYARPKSLYGFPPQ